MVAAILADKSKGMKRRRLTLDLSPELDEILQELADGSGGTKSEILRKSIVLMKVLADAKADGKKFGIVRNNEYLDTEIVGL